MYEKIKRVGMVAGGIVATAGTALAEGVTVDYSGAVTGITAQVQSAVTAALPVFGIMIGLWIGVKVFNRFVKK